MRFASFIQRTIEARRERHAPRGSGTGALCNRGPVGGGGSLVRTRRSLVEQGKYREFSRIRVAARSRIGENGPFPATLGGISLGRGTGNDRPLSREFLGRGRGNPRRSVGGTASLSGARTSRGPGRRATGDGAAAQAI